MTASILFTDVRGFARWAEKIEDFSQLNRFVADFPAILQGAFANHFIKGLVAGMCLDASNKRGLRWLLATRSRTRRLSAGKIEGCGGPLKDSQSFSGCVL